MTKGQRTKQQILEVTAPLFNKKGFDGTSLADLCHATQLTKGALYGNFESKEELAEAAFRYATRHVKGMVSDAVSKGASYSEKLMAMLTFFSKYVFNPPVAGGCPLLNTAIEADDHHVSLRGAVASELESTIRFMTDLIDKGKKAGEFRTDIKSREYAFLFFCSIEGALMFSRVSPTDEAMRIVVKQCKQILNQISIA